MASITIRDLEGDLKHRLRVRAAEHGRSMEEEAREILRQAVGKPRRRAISPPRSAPGSRPSVASISTCRRASPCPSRAASGGDEDDRSRHQRHFRQAAVATRNTGDYEGCRIDVIDPWQESGGG
jgi:antitoxin FitA-like protein